MSSLCRREGRRLVTASLNSAHEVAVGAMASETVLLAICRPSDSSIVTLLSSLSSLLLTKHLSTRGDGNPAVTRILERRKRSIQLELDFPSYVHETRICDGTEARFIKLSLGSYLSRYRGLTRLEIDNALYFIS